MKIGMNEILSGIEYTAIQKITKELVRDGFIVKNEFSPEQDNRLFFDLYAEKGEDKRIYELKIGKIEFRKNSLPRYKQKQKDWELSYILFILKFHALRKLILKD